MKAVKVLSVVVVIAMAAGVSVYGIDHAGRGSTFASPAAPSLDILSATAALSASSLQINAKTASMVETSSVFTDQQKQIINKELREIVLLPEQYPDIIFKSTNVIGTGTSANQYDLKIAGDFNFAWRDATHHDSDESDYHRQRNACCRRVQHQPQRLWRENYV